MLDLIEQKNYIQDLMCKLNFPSEAQKTFVDAFERILGDKTASAWFTCLLQQYDESEHCSYKQMIIDVGALGKALNIHQYTISLLMYLCMAEKLRCRYIEREIDESIYFNSMLDLRYKLEECRLVHGINGSFVASWFSKFFELIRFALGRLQFEITTTKDEFIVDNVILPAGSKAINVHIPRTGTKLDHKDVLEAYRLAAEMFADEFDSQPVLFTCYSWLLDPWNLKILSPSSNLAAFCNDFKIVESGNYNGYGEVWRLFDCHYTGNVSDLPRDSSLRRAYADRIERGEPIGWGRGMFIYRDGKIFN